MKATAIAALVLSAAALPALAQWSPPAGTSQRQLDFAVEQARRDRGFEAEQRRMADERDRTRRDVRRDMDARDPDPGRRHEREWERRR